MHILAAILVVSLVTLLAGVLVYVIVRQAFAIWNSQQSITGLTSTVASIQTNIASDESATDSRFLLIGKAVAANQTQTDTDKVASDTQLASLSDRMKLDVQSKRVSFTTSTTPIQGDSLSLSNVAPSVSSFTATPADSTKWLQLTDKDSTHFANLGVGSLWVDKGVAIPKGACVDFGNGISMCGDDNAFLSASSPGTGTTGSGLQLTIQGGTTSHTKNKVTVPLHTSLPGDSASGGMNRIVGDTVMTSDLRVGGDLSVGNVQAVGAGILSSKSGSHFYSAIDDTQTVSQMSMGFAYRGGVGGVDYPTAGSDVIQLTRRKADLGNHVRILGSLEVCDESGKNCVNVGVPKTPPSPAFYTKWTDS